MDSTAIVLHADTKLTSIAELPEAVRGKIPQRSGSYVLSRQGSRSGSMVLDDGGAQLVRLMAGGMSLPLALRQMAKETERDPDLVVKEAYPLIQTLLKEQYLTHRPQGSAKDVGAPVRFTYAVGDTFRAYTITRRVQVLEDCEVYKVTCQDGRSAALKLLRKRSSMVMKAFEREVEILRHLAGGIVPELFEAQGAGEDIFCVMEWIEGSPIHEWTVRVRNLPHGERYGELRRLCIELAQSYTWLHARGVLHSDLYPKNILVDRSGKVRLIDFGYTWCDVTNEIIGVPPRNNSAYFKAPDLAAATLTDTRPLPPPSVASEVYSLGAVMYLIIASRTYVDFALSREEQLSQVVSAPMVPFSRRCIPEWPKMEQVLQEMLEKDRSARLGSMEECVSRLELVDVPPEPAKQEREADVRGLASFPMLADYARATELPVFKAPTASINYGAAGVSYALLRGAATCNDPELLGAMDHWLCHARYLMEGSEQGAFNRGLGVTPEVVGPYALLHRIKGIELLEGLNAHARTDTFALRLACERFVSGEHRQEASLEFIFGKAGYLNAIEQLCYLTVENEPLKAVGAELAAQMLGEIEALADLKRSEVTFLGFAHGWSGIIYSLLSWGRAYDRTVIDWLLPYLCELSDYRIRTSLGSFWPKRFDMPVEAGDSASWCNGTAGFVLLWAEAYAATGDRHWLEVAEEAALHVLTHHDVSMSVCCGLAGRAYALGTLYRVSGEERWLSAARECIARAKPDTSKCEGFEHSLFKGIVGLELAGLELNRPEHLVFPTIASPFYGEPLPCGPWRSVHEMNPGTRG